MSRLALRVVALAGVIALLGVGSYAIAGSGSKNFEGSPLNGYEENPDISTVAGRLVQRPTVERRHLDPLPAQLLGPGGERPAGARALREVRGERRHLVLPLWTTGFQPPATAPATPVCPQSGTVEDSIVAADVIGPGGQGIEAGNLPEILAAMRAGHAYANVHSSKWPGGEIRAQVDRGGDGGGGIVGDDD